MISPELSQVLTARETLMLVAISFVSVCSTGFLLLWIELRRCGHSLADLVRVLREHQVAVSFPGRPDWNRVEEPAQRGTHDC